MAAADACRSEDAGDVCWICLDEGTPRNPLLRRCKCPRAAHQSCIARWQLQSAGKLEEKHCRFCQSVLPDWRPAMTPAGHRPVTPFMRVSYGGKSFKVKVNPGPEGLQQFELEVRRLLKLPDEQEFDVIFHCRAPCSGDLLQLHGTSAFDAAVHCAAMSSSTGSVKKRPNVLKQKAGTFLRQMFSRLQLGRSGAASVSA